MAELMHAKIEDWPLAADEVGIWLLSGRAPWVSAPLSADQFVHFEVETLLAAHDATDPLVIHSPGWRPGMRLHPVTGKLTPDGSIILTYFSVHDVRDVDGLALTQWPDAMPVTPMLAELMGPPAAHAADEMPRPRRVDVLYHALRHLRHQMAENATTAARLAGHQWWHRHLAPLAPALAGMYSTPHDRGDAA